MHFTLIFTEGGRKTVLQSGNFLMEHNLFKSQGAANNKQENNGRENSKNKLLTFMKSALW